jgi:hypothetical protein
MANNPTLQNLRDDLDGRISAAKTSGFWNQAFKDLALNDAGKQVCNAYRWGFLELALITQSRDASEYYDYPVSFTPDSIYQLSVAGEDYGAQDGRTRVNWERFQERKNIGDDNDYVFTNHNGFYFIYPVPADGLDISIFGLKKWVVLTAATEIAVTPDELNDAIVKLALAKCLRKAKKYAEAKAELLEVLDPQVGLLAQIWAKTHEESPGGYKGEATSSRF